VIAAVVAVAQPDRSRLIAFVSLSEGHTATAEALRAWCRSRLPQYMVPTEIRVETALPLLPAGKLNRSELSKLARG
jgi:acyl-CoA synthetase (AMP-forming)/AMP-acid ligase II